MKKIRVLCFYGTLQVNPTVMLLIFHTPLVTFALILQSHAAHCTAVTLRLIVYSLPSRCRALAI